MKSLEELEEEANRKKLQSQEIQDIEEHQYFSLLVDMLIHRKDEKKNQQQLTEIYHGWYKALKWYFE